MRYRFIEDHRDVWPIVVQCDVLQVSRGGFYAWRKRSLSGRARRRADLTERIREIHAVKYQDAYGAVRVHRELAAQGWTSDLMSYDSRHLLHYFRLMPDRRFLFGQRGAISANAAATKANRHQNRQDFEAMFPGLKGVETSHHWTGLLCTTMSRHPYIGSLGDKPGLLAALGYHGNGVAMASHAGRLVGDLAAGAFVDLPDALATPLARFPLPDHRRHFLRAAYLHYRLMDAI